MTCPDCHHPVEPLRHGVEDWVYACQCQTWTPVELGQSRPQLDELVKLGQRQYVPAAIDDLERYRAEVGL